MKKLSIVVPVFNEEKTISEIIGKLINLNISGWEKELIVVDDGSTDSTPEVISSFRNVLIVLRHKRKKGKGAAICSGFQRISGDAVIVQDADLEYDPSDIEKMISELEASTGVDAVYGSRNINPEKRGYFHYVLGVRLLTGLCNLLFGARLTDVYTCYKLIKSGILRELNLTSDGFEVEAEITAKLLKKGCRISEVCVKYNPRSFQEGKKIRIRDGCSGFWTIIKIWLKR